MTTTPIAVLGIDLGKNSCSVAGMDATGAVVVALAAKIARIAWAVLRHEEDFDWPEPVAA
ncbi:hypothetical protein [Novosphingobium sp. B-7]|jgi:molecular chaperone DnaK (HSP70)|uniref:hypothetical protein n=1 Tax=Novosphingobium sp. B-7 TaxID=1298855 RepID=UPI0003B3926D|nr:hypothetical protein [Novosphingobium sp. B-7]